jgi:aminopeptidase N/puromycin-sensitive aminopeptidase
MTDFASRDCRLLLVIFSLCIVATAQRLPVGVTPSHYKLWIDPNIGTKSFSGEETIDIVLKERGNEIVLNSLDLDISLAEVRVSGTSQPARVVYDKPSEMVHLSLANAIPAGPAQLHLKWSAPLTDGLRGLYLSKSARRSYVVTQFEGTYARMMFPCFDEPGYKATFDLTVIADQGDTVISNGRIIADTPVPGSVRHTITFSTSPRMSTYLVAIAVGDWQCLERTVEDIPIRVCAVPEKKELGRFALEVADHSIRFYNDWYGIKYPYGKLDMLAIPDYEWGGMENTASIFYRDTALLFDDSSASIFTRRRQAVIIAHEIAHQWFGDLVTPVWWDDIWLNEGFATWMQSKPIAAWHPEWHLENEEAISAQQIISLDSLGATRAIHSDPKTPSQIKEMFDGITYEKAGAVLSMLESYVGAESFRNGVNAYLQAHANGNATAADFWQAEAQASGKPVDEIMPTFVLQPGVPVLTLKAECVGNKAKIDFAQQRFFLRTVQKPEQGRAEASLWQIPVCMKGPEISEDQCTIIAKKQQTLQLDSCPEWLFANRDAKGYYRIAYAPDNMEKLAEVAEARLTVPERIALIEDAWAMSRAGRTPIAGFMDLVHSLKNEHDISVLDLLAEHLDYAGAALISADQNVAYHKFIRDQFGALARDTGWNASPSDSDETKALRASLLRILGNADDPDALATALKLVQQYFKDPTSVEGTLVGSAFQVTAGHGDTTLYNQLYSRLAKADSTQEYNLCLNALALFDDPALAQRTLGLVHQGSIRQENYPRIFSTLLENPSTRDAAWAYLKLHWEDLAEKVTSFGGYGAVTALGSSCSAAMRGDVQQFFSNHAAPGAERAVQQSLEGIDACLAFKQAQQSSMASWMTAAGTVGGKGL